MKASAIDIIDISTDFIVLVECHSNYEDVIILIRKSNIII